MRSLRSCNKELNSRFMKQKSRSRIEITKLSRLRSSLKKKSKLLPKKQRKFLKFMMIQLKRRLINILKTSLKHPLSQSNYILLPTPPRPQLM